MKDSVLGLKEEYIKDEMSKQRKTQIRNVVIVLFITALLCGITYYFVYYRDRVKTNYQAKSITCVDLANHPYELIEVSTDDVKIVFDAKTYRTASRFSINVKDVCYLCELGSTSSDGFRFFYYVDDNEYALLPEGYMSGYQLMKKNMDGTLTVELNYHLIEESSDEEIIPVNEWITYTIVFDSID